MANILPVEAVKYIIDTYGVQFKSYYQDRKRHRESILKNNHEVIYLYDINTSLTVDAQGRKYLVGYNRYNALCYAVAPRQKPDTLGENFLMTKIYPEFSHYIRPASDDETLKSFNQILNGKKGIIHPSGILEYMLLLEDAKGGAKTTSIKRSSLECFVTSNVDTNWHQKRLIKDNIMLKVGAETFYKCYQVSDIILGEIKKDFKLKYNKEIGIVTITNLLTKEIYKI